jgi:hypothetical protein
MLPSHLVTVDKDNDLLSQEVARRYTVNSWLLI